MRKIEIETCEWLGPRWSDLIRQGYQTARVNDGVAVMCRGSVALAHWNLMRRQEQQAKP